MSRSKSPTPSHWLEYIAYRGFERILKLMSIETTFKAGELLGRILHRINGTRRRQVIRNLRFAFGAQLSSEDAKDLTARVFERTGANFLSSLRVPFLNDEEVLKHLTFEGTQELLAANRDSGIVLVSPHMGNWELLAQAVFLTGADLKIGTHYRPLNNTLINAVVERRRKKRGLKLFAKRTSTHQLTSFVRSGSILAVLADQRVGSRGAACSFFGRPTTCSPLPHLLAKRGKGKLFGISCVTTGTAQWKVSFREISEPSAQACAQSLETAWRSSPIDVFWFEDRWRLRGNDAIDFLSKYHEPHAVTRPLRAVSLSPSTSTLPYPDSLITLEHAPLHFDQNDKALTQDLLKVDRSGNSPVDLFLCPESQIARVKKLTGKVHTLASETTHSCMSESEAQSRADRSQNDRRDA